MEQSNREIVTSILERDVSNLYSNLRTQALSLVEKQPLIKKVAENYISANELNWINQIQEKLDLIIEASFINPSVSVEEALVNANKLINASIGQFLEAKLGVPMNTIQIATQTLFGIKL